MSNAASSQSVLSRAQNFVSENKKVIIAGVAVVAVVGVAAAAYYSTSTNAGVPRVPRDDLEHGKSPSAKKKSRKHKKGPPTAGPGPTSSKLDDVNGPILEEHARTDSPDTSVQLNEADIGKLSPEERNKRAAALKMKGNTAYTQRQFSKAAQLYTQAIEITSKPEAVYWSNRAACYVNYSPPMWDRVLADCDMALKLDPVYTKALNRRAEALENMDQLEDALRDFVACSLLENMTVEKTAQAVDRVLRKICEPKSLEILKEREARLPSPATCTAYFNSYRPRPLPVLPEDSTFADRQLLLACEAMQANNYVHALSLINEALSEPLEPGQALSNGVLKAEALTMRGSFKYLMNDTNGAEEDFTNALEANPASIHTWLKMANIHLDHSNIEESFSCFEKALSYDPKDADVYFHRGQVLFVLNQHDKALDDYARSVELDNNFVFSRIQLAVAHYKAGEQPKSMAEFRKIMKHFPQHSEPPNYYGEVLLDQERFQEAIEKFDRAIELERAKLPAPINVLPMVNKATAVFHWKVDTEGAESLCKEALEIDPLCDGAFAALGQMYLQMRDYDKAITAFRQHLAVSTNMGQIAVALYHRYSTEAHVKAMKNYPALAAQLS